MKIIFQFPPDNLLLSILIWCTSLVFLKWVLDLYRNKDKGVTVAKTLTLKKLPFFIFPGNVSAERIEKVLKRKVMGVEYIYGKRLKMWIAVFILAWLFVFIMGFIEIIDNRVF